MGKQENRKTSGRRLDWFVVLMVGIVGYFSYMMVSQHFYLNSVNRDYDAAQQRLQSAQQENDALQQEKAQLKGWWEQIGRWRARNSFAYTPSAEKSTRPPRSGGHQK